MIWGSLRAHIGQCLENIFLSQYLFIAILCVKMSRVNKALQLYFCKNCWDYHIDYHQLDTLNMLVWYWLESIFTNGTTGIPNIGSQVTLKVIISMSVIHSAVHALTIFDDSYAHVTHNIFAHNIAIKRLKGILIKIFFFFKIM